MGYTLDIDGYIGSWYNSKSNVKEILSKHKSKAVTARFNSLGGNLDHGLDICAQFEEHGDVTVDYVAFNASSSTVAGLGAKHVRMHVDGFYLIHKVMSWVGEWGLMNEDKIQEVIDKLEKEKKENEKITLQLARKYAVRSGKTVVEILNLMKEETWLTADEAKSWGFVDEIYGKTEGKTNFVNLEGKFNALGLPPLPEQYDKTNENKGIADTIKQGFADLKDFFVNQKEEKNTSTNNNSIISMKKDWTHINTLLGTEGVELKDGFANLSEDTLAKMNKAIEDALLAKTNAENALTDKSSELTALQADFDSYKNAAGDKTESTKEKTDGGENSFYSEEIQAAAEAQKFLNMINGK